MPHPIARRAAHCSALLVTLLSFTGCLGRNASAAELSPAERAETERIFAERGGRDGSRTLSESEINTSTAQRFDQLLAGRVAGVQVISRGNGQFSVRIRNAGGFRTAGEPLYLLDGVQVTASDLALLNPAYVERIEVIKDGMAAAYGVQGANGVLLVTTVRPR